MRINRYIFFFLLASCSQKVASPQTTVKPVSDLQEIKTFPFIVDDGPMRQLLINQTRATTVQGKIPGLSSLQNRRRLQNDLDRLRQKQDATLADYQHLLRRIEITRQVELSILRNMEVTRTLPTRVHRGSRPIAPPPKAVANSMPTSVPGLAPKVNQDNRPVRSAISLQNSPRKPKSVKAFKPI